MSGGVDSAVAAFLLQQQGFSVVGCTLILWGEEDLQGAPDAGVERARRVAAALGVPHSTMDVRDLFAAQVVEYFIKEYQQGRTPNPCAKCNARVRFGLLADMATHMGLAHIATGHYARTVGPERRLARAADRLKDQSYVLAEVDPALLSRTLFPVGEMTKAEVRGLAAEVGLEGYETPDSQEICFVPDDDHRRFLRERLGELPGDIVDLQGRRLGAHRGTYNFTIGQRRGIGIAAEDPLYVVALDEERREVVVGPEQALAVEQITACEATWHGPPPASGAYIQIRSNGTPLHGRLIDPAPDDPSAAQRSRSFTVSLDEPASGVAYGQTAVVYEDALVVCAGTISAAVARGPESSAESEGTSLSGGDERMSEPMI
jgi:tRNA-specific 2-thiouridylase